MTFDKINRRTHLYLGIALTPWFLLYALSSVILNHGSVVGKREPPKWTFIYERDYHLPPITEEADEWVAGENMLKNLGTLGRYRARVDENENLVILRQKFLSTTRYTYNPKLNKLTAEERRLPWNEALTQAHFRAGFAFPYFIDQLWAVTIDLLVLSTLIWIASGLILWIRLRRFRIWGLVAIAGGLLSFVLAVAGL